MDSVMKAGDNGEYFYEYVMNNHKDVLLYFIISNKSTDFNRLKEKGFNVVDTNDKIIPTIFRKATYILSSKYQYPVNSLFGRFYKDKCVFLNHGISNTINSVNNYFTKIINGNFKYVCSSSENDKNIMLNFYKMTKCKPIVTGLCRWDNLIYKNSKHIKNEVPHILITFHWRDGELNKNEGAFAKSDYLKNINDLLNSKEIKHLSSKCIITFMYHAMFAKYKKFFKVPSYIKFGNNMQFQDLLVDSDMIITDFSSNAFEMSVIGKPTLYYIPDIDYVNKNMKQYNMDNLKKFCIGKYCNNFDELFFNMSKFISGDFNLSEKNKELIRKFIGNVDNNNCNRLYNFLFK